MHIVYIKSLIRSRFYIGQTENIDNRLNQHNKGKVKSTRGYLPWEVIYTEKFSARSDACKREQEIKRFKSGILFKKLISRGAGVVNRSRL
jgi:putative endonuclease